MSHCCAGSRGTLFPESQVGEASSTQLWCWALGLAHGTGLALPATTLGWLELGAELVSPGLWLFLTAQVGGAHKAGTDLEKEWAIPRGQDQSLCYRFSTEMQNGSAATRVPCSGEVCHFLSRFKAQEVVSSLGYRLTFFEA